MATFTENLKAVLFKAVLPLVIPAGLGVSILVEDSKFASWIIETTGWENPQIAGWSLIGVAVAGPLYLMFKHFIQEAQNKIRRNRK